MGNILVKPDPIQDMKFTAEEAIEPGTPYYVDGFHGVVRTDAASGDEAILDISSRVWQMDLTGITVSKGGTLYIDASTGVVSTTDTGVPFGKLTSNKDGDEIADVYILPQSVS